MAFQSHMREETALRRPKERHAFKNIVQLTVKWDRGVSGAPAQKPVDMEPRLPQGKSLDRLYMGEETALRRPKERNAFKNIVQLTVKWDRGMSGAPAQKPVVMELRLPQGKSLDRLYTGEETALRRPKERNACKNIVQLTV